MRGGDNLVATLRRVRRWSPCPWVEVEIRNPTRTRWIVARGGELRMETVAGKVIVDALLLVLVDTPPARVVEPGQCDRWRQPLWRCDRLDRSPWRWLAGGVEQCWNLAPGPRVVDVWYEHPEGNRWDRGDNFPGFAVLRDVLEIGARNAGASLWTRGFRSNRVRIRL